VHGYVAYAEECVIHWLDDRQVSREQLLELLTASLPAVVVAASGERLDAVLAVLGHGAPFGPVATGPPA
jgi:hypothetical protein